MTIDNYLEHINLSSQKIFNEFVQDKSAFSKAHYLSSCIYSFSNLILESNEKNLLVTVTSQLEMASISVAYGLYRQAFSSLRLAFEMGLGLINFSVHKIEHYEWIKGQKDIKWSEIIDIDNGVLSVRFAKAFFPELSPLIISYNDKAKKVYRRLSEYVHGNSETWDRSGIKIKRNKTLEDSYFKHFKDVTEILLVSLCCRYLKGFTAEQLESLDSVFEELNHVSPVRELFGGPKEL